MKLGKETRTENKILNINILAFNWKRIPKWRCPIAIKESGNGKGKKIWTRDAELKISGTQELASGGPTNLHAHTH